MSFSAADIPSVPALLPFAMVSVAMLVFKFELPIEVSGGRSWRIELACHFRTRLPLADREVVYCSECSVLYKPHSAEKLLEYGMLLRSFSLL